MRWPGADHQCYRRPPVRDWAELARIAAADPLSLLGRWLPGGRIQGGEYLVRNPRRPADRAIGSFSIAITGPRAGCWADFADPEARGRTLIALRAYLDDCTPAEAAHRVAADLGLETL